MKGSKGVRHDDIGEHGQARYHDVQVGGGPEGSLAAAAPE